MDHQIRFSAACLAPSVASPTPGPHTGYLFIADPFTIPPTLNGLSSPLLPSPTSCSHVQLYRPPSPRGGPVLPSPVSHIEILPSHVEVVGDDFHPTFPCVKLTLS